VRRLVVVILSVTAALAFGACSSDGSGDGSAKGGGDTTTSTTTPSAEWDPTAEAQLDPVAAQVSKAFPGQCEKLEELARVDYVRTAAVIKSSVPLAVASCEAGGENLEFSAFADAKTRDEFVRTRSAIICARSAKAKYDLDGLHWVVGGNWSIQPDTQGMGRVLARAVNAKYQAEPCSGKEQINWEEAAVERVEGLAATLAAQPRVKCDQFVLLDRSEYSRNPQYTERLPAAFGRCSGPSGAQIWIAAFSDKSVARDAFIEKELENLCASSLSGVQGVRGDDWGIIATQTQVAGLAAAATGGTALPPSC
jgi:hypothetical protein